MQIESNGAHGLQEKETLFSHSTCHGKCVPFDQSHKDNFPGRAVVSQIGDLTYLICKELTRILNPLDETGDSFIRDSFHLKDMLKVIELMNFVA